MRNPYQQAKFAFSVNHPRQMPAQAVAEVAFSGRSNAGKSSALNVLTGKRNLARVSKTPGRTQLINYFALEKAGDYLVDLPGYGYAKVPDALRQHWEELLGNYLLKRAVLRGVVLLMDSRHPMRDLDIRMLECCAQRQISAHILLTKSDKLNHSAAARQLQDVRKELALWRADFGVQLFSSLEKKGVDILVAKLNQWFAY